MKYLRFSNFFFLFLTLLSCGSSDDSISTPEPQSGEIAGSVNLYDEQGFAQEDNAGMSISLEGLPFETTSDSEGRFTLSDVPFGTYTLVYESSGYGTFRVFDFEHNEENTFITDTPSLSEVSTTEITELTPGTADNGETIVVSATITPEPNNANTRFIRFFFSSQVEVSADNFEAVLETLQAQINPYDLRLTRESFEQLGFETGETVYVKAYGESFFSNAYEDPDLERTIYPNLNATSAPAVAVVVP